MSQQTGNIDTEKGFIQLLKESNAWTKQVKEHYRNFVKDFAPFLYRMKFLKFCSIKKHKVISLGSGIGLMELVLLLKNPDCEVWNVESMKDSVNIGKDLYEKVSQKVPHIKGRYHWIEAYADEPIKEISSIRFDRVITSFSLSIIAEMFERKIGGIKRRKDSLLWSIRDTLQGIVEWNERRKFGEFLGSRDYWGFSVLSEDFVKKRYFKGKGNAAVETLDIISHLLRSGGRLVSMGVHSDRSEMLQMYYTKKDVDKEKFPWKEMEKYVAKDQEYTETERRLAFSKKMFMWNFLKELFYKYQDLAKEGTGEMLAEAGLEMEKAGYFWDNSRYYFKAVKK